MAHECKISIRDNVIVRQFNCMVSYDLCADQSGCELYQCLHPMLFKRRQDVRMPFWVYSTTQTLHTPATTWQYQWDRVEIKPISAQQSGQATNYSLTNNSALSPSSLNLTNNDHFLIALKAPESSGSWLAPTSEQCFSDSSTCTLTWDLGGSTIAVDLEQVLPPAGVPVPPAVWLFGSGLLGMVGIARRRKTA